MTLAACGGNDEATQTRTTETKSPHFVVGAVDDVVREPGPPLDQLRDAGFGAVGITSLWQPGLSAPPAAELDVLRDVAARAEGRRIFLSVYQQGSSTTPLTDEARRQFGSYVAAIVEEVPEIRDVIVGNEPNLNRFWMPQFDDDGGDAAASAYFALLVAAYDAAKNADKDVRVWGGALAPRGIDRPGTGRDTHSPTTFIRDLGAAFQASGRRARPPLDGFAFHPYPESSSIPLTEPTDPSSRSIGLADYEQKLRPLVDEAFGPGLPVLYSEVGVETILPGGKSSLYEGKEVGEPVDETTQAKYYGDAIHVASCQKNVAALLLFHSHDEKNLMGFQSGVYYVDGSPKTSLEPVRKAIQDAGKGC